MFSAASTTISVFEGLMYQPVLLCTAIQCIDLRHWTWSLDMCLWTALLSQTTWGVHDCAAAELKCIYEMILVTRRREMWYFSDQPLCFPAWKPEAENNDSPAHWTTSIDFPALSLEASKHISFFLMPSVYWTMNPETIHTIHLLWSHVCDSCAVCAQKCVKVLMLAPPKAFQHNETDWVSPVRRQRSLGATEGFSFSHINISYCGIMKNHTDMRQSH